MSFKDNEIFSDYLGETTWRNGATSFDIPYKLVLVNNPTGRSKKKSKQIKLISRRKKSVPVFIPKLVRRKGDGSGVVYFIQGSVTKLIKIGLTSDRVEFRLKDLQACSPDQLVLLAVIESTKIKELEKQLHERFKVYRKHGEWFEPATEIISFISTSKQ
jgi:hypothetical protein